MTPTATLLEALAAWLRDELQAELAGARAYEARIAVNLLATLRRELELAPALARCDASITAGQGLPSRAVAATLARALRDGQVSADAQLLQALRQRAMLRCAVDVPRYPGLVQARQRWPDLADVVDAAMAEAAPDASDPRTSAARRDRDAEQTPTQQHGEPP